ncbi:hypothetical protein [Aurantimonas sp. C2-3-R2]|uniref:hypothetical protein n=1 Tax=Aurantimonas sp. C2-3-R2 TaxID=3114363 RepID=UPI003FA45CF3
MRPVAHAGQRLKEAEKLGFRQSVLPAASADLPRSGEMVPHEVETLPDLVGRVASGGLPSDG